MHTIQSLTFYILNPDHKGSLSQPEKEKYKSHISQVHLKEGHWINNTSAMLPAGRNRNLNYLMIPNWDIGWVSSSVCKKPDLGAWGLLYSRIWPASLLPISFSPLFFLFFCLCPFCHCHFFLVFFLSTFPFYMSVLFFVGTDCGKDPSGSPGLTY